MGDDELPLRRRQGADRRRVHRLSPCISTAISSWRLISFCYVLVCYTVHDVSTLLLLLSDPNPAGNARGQLSFRLHRVSSDLVTTKYLQPTVHHHSEIMRHNRYQPMLLDVRHTTGMIDRLVPRLRNHQRATSLIARQHVRMLLQGQLMLRCVRVSCVTFV